METDLKQCSNTDCTQRTNTRGMCKNHYMKWRRSSSYNPVRQLHGHSETPEWRAWWNMKQRCNNPNNHKYKDYGGRGISVCSEWDSSFNDFYLHLGNRPSNKHSLDRINNNGNYEPGNVRWATYSEQNSNRKRS